jgi:two-component system, chemotaxis family, CheB/CheR fusion protein
MEPVETNTVSLEQLLTQLAEERDFDLRGYKRATLERRIKKRMAGVKTADYADYLEHIRRNPEEISALLNTVLINVTEFFRDPQAWDFLREEVLPSLLRNKKPGDVIRAWCAGCASGEEVYSLGILVAEYFGPKLLQHDVRIYATDVDEDALSVGRRAEYHEDNLRRVQPEWQQKYFQRTRSTLRVNREIRKMVVFGRSNLAQDAPISHVNLILCRNVLIYFDLETQQQILTRLHYALERDGVIFFGKAESQLASSSLFLPLSSRWRIFRRSEADGHFVPKRAALSTGVTEAQVQNHDELELLRLQHRYLLENLGAGVISLDERDVITEVNQAAQECWRVAATRLVGKRIQQSELATRYPELVDKIEAARIGDHVQFRSAVKNNSGEHLLDVTIKPLLLNGERKGTIIHCEDVNPREQLQITVERLEVTGEELQSVNEELETTNEELQSTNEELETTNEELQSTNEELEATNEELQSLNEELENMNEELGLRSRELDAVNIRYLDTLERMPWPVMVIATDGRIQFWNSAAQGLFSIAAKSVVGIELGLIPLESSLRKTLVRAFEKVTKSQKPVVIGSTEFEGNQFSGCFEIHLEPLSRAASQSSILIMFGPFQKGKAARSVSRPRSNSSSRLKKSRVPKRKK